MTQRSTEEKGRGVPGAPQRGGGTSRGVSRDAPRAPIRRLESAVIDQIAAGEVVERPASVVKELVENSLDAGAGRLRIEIAGGGIDRITVRDDGAGMTPAEARLALERHATSKLSAVEDLERITSFGFRGEALPAIASVSTFSLVTRARGEKAGLELRRQGAQMEEREAPAIAAGTRIDVVDLFAQVPARRKFLKQPATEWRHCIDWLSRAALARPDVHFDLERDGRRAATWPAVHSRRERVAAVLSSRESEGMVEVAEHGDASGTGARLEGFCSRPDAHRAGSQGLYLFVDGRPVRDRLLRHALLEVYRDVLPKGRYPSAVLFLELPPGEVDVNVHPAKWEVRFRDPRAVHRFVAGAVRRALARRSWLGSPDAGTASASLRDHATADRAGETHEHPAFGSGGVHSRAERGPDAVGEGDWSFARRGDALPEAQALDFRTPEQAGVRGLRLAECTLHGQLHATYLLIEGPDGLLLVDQHTAHERVLYERLRRQWRDGKVAMQALLVPVTVALPPADASRLDEFAHEASGLGFELERFDEGAWLVRAVPAILADRDPAQLLLELVDAVGREPSGPPVPRGLDPAEALFATLACHSARRAGDRLEAAEQRALLEEVDAIPWSPTCPHGRPVVVPIPLREIERRFRRT